MYLHGLEPYDMTIIISWKKHEGNHLRVTETTTLKPSIQLSYVRNFLHLIRTSS